MPTDRWNGNSYSVGRESKMARHFTFTTPVDLSKQFLNYKRKELFCRFAFVFNFWTSYKVTVPEGVLLHDKRIKISLLICI